MSTHLIRISAARRIISEGVLEFLDRSLQFRDAIDPVGSVLGNAVRKVPAMSSRHLPCKRGEILAVQLAWRRFLKEKSNLIFLRKKFEVLRAPSPKFFVVARLLSLQKM